MIKFVVDSASDIDQSEAGALGVTLMPMQIRFGTEEFLDGVDISHREFFERLTTSREFPQTSQINEYRWEECFKKLADDGSEVVVLTMSSELSGTYLCARNAARNFSGKVFVVDSYNVCIGERILLEYALRICREGVCTAAEIVRELEEKKSKIQLLAVLDTLKYLRKGGRISSVAAVAGEILSVKPVISITEGKVKLAGKAIGSKKGNNLLMRLAEKCGGIDFDMPYALAYSGLSDEFLQKYLRDSEKLWKGKTEFIPSYMIGSTIGTHAGPNAIAVAFFSN